MELKLFDSKTLSVSEKTLLRKPCPGGSWWCSSSTGPKRVVKLSSPEQRSSCRGIIIKASYSSTSNGSYAPKRAVGSVDLQGNGVAESGYLYKMNGTDVAGSSLFPPNAILLRGFDDEYGGVVVDSDGLPASADVFASSLRSSLFDWKVKGKKGVWLKLPVERSELVPIAVKEGFEYHHAERGYLMLTCWLPEGPSMLPANASHQVGVGGFVVNERNEVLVVQEKFCAPSSSGLWKIPTGFVLESEEIYSGAVREVKEETGIDTEFVEVIAFRHAHNLAFDKSDLLFVCMLKPLSTKIILDEQEIQRAKWMPLSDFVEQPLIREDSMFKKIMDICIARLGKQYCGLSAHQLVSMFDGRLSCLYYNVIDSQDSPCSAC